MKFLVCCLFAAFAVVEYVNGYHPRSYEYSRPYPSRGVDRGFGRFLNDEYASSLDKDAIVSKANDICPGYGEQFMNSSVEAISCFNLVDENQETACSLIQKHFERCAQPIINTLEQCLPEQSSTIPALFVRSTVKISEHLCKTDGEHIFELGNPCIKSFNYRTQTCVRRLKSRVQQYSRKIPSAQDICDFLGSFRPCIQTHLQNSCGNEKTRDAFLGVYDVAVSVCNPTNNNEVEVVSP
ncbi:uncharacterized protein LOC132703241 isoform X2 [Cylas formicarius]|nr:uncharacterized protein LOC132703241 isoform X2 [Cylas formicarius]